MCERRRGRRRGAREGACRGGATILQSWILRLIRNADLFICLCVYYCRTYYKVFRGGGGGVESGGHVLRVCVCVFITAGPCVFITAGPFIKL